MKKHGIFWLFVLFSLFSLARCHSAPNTDSRGGANPPAAGPEKEVQTKEAQTTVEDFDGKSITLRHGAKGDPGIIGCSDGTREAFHDVNAFPTIEKKRAFFPHPTRGTWLKYTRL